MSKSEMRFVRRELINWFFHACGTNLELCKEFVREQEIIDHGQELKAYA